MLQSTKFQNALKALLLIGLGLFLYSRIANGTLYYYIAQRFALYTLIAIVGLIVVGLSYYSETKGKHTSHMSTMKMSIINMRIITSITTSIIIVMG